MSSNTELCWDEFCDWADQNGVGDPRCGMHEDDWNPWWECWQAALKAKKEQEELDSET